MKQKIFVLYTGGTIGMTQSSAGLRPDTALVDKALAPFSDGLDFEWHVCQPLIDSSAVTLQNQRDWLELIIAKLPDYDGILVLHGTDTMAYTANLFARVSQGSEKRVVMTSSRRAYEAANGEGAGCVASAVAVFSLELTNVAIDVEGKLFPAVGSSKVSTETAAGFDNLHFGALAEWEKNKGWHNIRTAPTQHSDGLKPRLPSPEAKVSVRTLIPGYAAQELSDGLPHLSTQALILQSYGHGNAPSDDAFVRAVQAFTQQGKLLLNISQVPQGCAAAVYAQGDALRQAGIINGGKCNLETATALMTLAVSHDWNADKVQQELRQLNLL